METTVQSHSDARFESGVTKLPNMVDLKLESEMIETESVIPKTESYEVDIVEYEVPVHSNKPVIQLNTQCPKIELDTENCKIFDSRTSKKTDRAKLSQHNGKLLKISHKNKRFIHICEICYAEFNQFKILEVHISEEHGSGKPVDNKCRCCKLSFKQPSCLRRHINRAHLGSKTSKLAYCPHCYKIFNATEQLHAHIKRMHVTITPGMIYCKKCHATFKSKHKLECHIQSKHSKNNEHSHRRIKCKLCHENFNHRYYLKEHYEEVHLNGSSVRKLQCLECTCSFRHPTSLYRHVQHKHNKNQCNMSPSSVKPLQTLREDKGYNHNVIFKCDYCKLCFTLKKNLSDHIRLTHNSPLLPCTGCKAQFTCRDTLKDHIIASHPLKQSKHSCQICDKTFTSYMSFSYHNMHLHHEGTICPVCGIEFATRQSLRSHSLVHFRTNYSNKSRVFTCDLCQTPYTTKLALRKHVQSHLLESKFECRICSQLFKTMTNLDAHMKRRHKPTNQIKCFKCNEIFNQGRLFRKHMTDDHKVIIIFR